MIDTLAPVSPKRVPLNSSYESYVFSYLSYAVSLPALQMPQYCKTYHEVNF